MVYLAELQEKPIVRHFGKVLVNSEAFSFRNINLQRRDFLSGLENDCQMHVKL